MIGRVVGNTYRILEKIGEGGMGAVYRAVDQMLERDVALKAIRPELSREPEIVERFRSEARTLARLSHPAIANVYTFFFEGEELFLAMELVRGRPLSRVLSSEGPIPWERAVALLGTALEGIEQAHRAGVVHRDLKPDNLMVTEAGTLKVMDFGIARVMGSGHLTRTGLLVGTLRYMSPEQIRGEEVDGRADIYALGAVLYEMLTGKPPFEGGTDWAILRAQIEDAPRPPSEHLPLLPWWIDRAVLKALAKDPAERFQSVEEMRRTLLRQGETMSGVRAGSTAPLSLEELPTVLTPPGSRTPTPRPAPPPIPTAYRAPATPPPVTPISVATQAPVAGPSSYRPVEIPGRGTPVWKLLIAAVLVVAVLGVAATAFFLNRRMQPAETAAEVPAVQPVPENAAAASVPAPVETPSAPAVDPPAAARPAPAPAMPLRPAPADDPEPEPVESLSSEEAETTVPYTPPAEEPEPALAPREEMSGLASDLQARSLHLLEIYQAFLEAKDEAGQEITDDDEQLEEDIEALADAAESFNDQLGKGGFLARRRQRSGEDIIRVQQRARELARRGERVEALMDKVQPGPEVRQGWQDVRRRWRRVAEIASGLR
jgi:serine/threonine protein kinase